MFAYIKRKIENPALPKSGFTLDIKMHLDISFHKSQLTQESSYIETKLWIYNKKAVLSPQNKDEECFNWAAIAASHHQDIIKDLQRISKLEPYSDFHNFERWDFPVAVSNIDKFEKNNKDIAVNVLHIHQKEEGKSKCKLAILRRLDGNITRNKVVNLLLITDGENRHYTAIKSLSKLLSRENRVKRDQQCYCVRWLQEFNSTSSQAFTNGDVRIPLRLHAAEVSENSKL